MRALYIAMRYDHILKEGEYHGTICNSPHFRYYRRYNRVYSCGTLTVRLYLLLDIIEL